MNKFKSFVFSETTKKQIDMMPTAEMKLKFYEAATDYGMYGKEPENLSGIEMIIWLPMKDLIDNSKSSKGGAPHGNQNARTSKTACIEESEKTAEQQDFNGKQLEKAGNNLKTAETTCPEENQSEQSENSKTTLNNLNGNPNHNLNGNPNHNPNGNGNERENRNPNAGGAAPETLSPPQTEYARKIFRIFRDAGLPCARENEISFLQTDFKNALSVIHRKAELQNIHSDDIIQACRNFTGICSDPASFCGFRQRIGFYQLVQKQWFYDLLPANFDRQRFLVRGAESAEAENKNPQRTPEQLESQLLDEMRGNPRFIPKILEHYRDEWIERGAPAGERYLAFQDEKCLSGYGKKLKADFESGTGGAYGGQKS